MPPKPRASHVVAVLALDGVLPFDLGIACEAFVHVRLSDGTAPYRLRVCGEGSQVDAGSFTLNVPFRLPDLLEADTIVVAGIAEPREPVSQAVLTTLRTAWARGARLASICSGAFVLAEAGLLDGRRATTHWRGVAELARRFPQITVEPNVLFVEEDRIVTSAGASAGLDMCLSLIAHDWGQAVAADAARMAVAPLYRDGGQAQFIRSGPVVSPAGLAPLIDWMMANLDQPIGVETLARQAGMSTRTFARRFQEQAGITPIQWLIKARIRRAQELLENSDAPIDQVAAAVGFDAPVTFRARFKRIVGVNPASYRQRFARSGLSSATMGAAPLA